MPAVSDPRTDNGTPHFRGDRVGTQDGPRNQREAEEQAARESAAPGEMEYPKALYCAVDMSDPAQAKAHPNGYTVRVAANPDEEAHIKTEGQRYGRHWADDPSPESLAPPAPKSARKERTHASP